MFTVRGNSVYVDVLREILKDYINTKHRSIGLAPMEASKNVNEEVACKNPYGVHTSVSKFKVRDRVRISRYKGPI